MPPRMLTYRWFARVYGWTPHQVREELTLDEFEWLPKIERGEAGAAEVKERQERAASMHKQKPQAPAGW